MCSISVLMSTMRSFSFFFTKPAPTEISTLSLHDALPILVVRLPRPLALRLRAWPRAGRLERPPASRSEEHTSELQSRENLVCRLLLEKKKTNTIGHLSTVRQPAGYPLWIAPRGATTILLR